MTGEIEAGKVRSMHPQKFAMWLFLVSVTMIFISLSSGYIVQKAAKGLFVAELPSLFFWTTIIILASSVTMQLAYISAKRNNIKNLRISLIATFLLALIFMYGQWEAWWQMIDMGMHPVSQNSLESFIYIFSGLHIAHLIGAVIFLLIVLNKAFKYQVHSKSLVRIEMCATFWHFLGGLWLYLYLFLIFNI
ncbi:MAG: cytochrome c oxidase subunit 3 [Ekhidna sp.]|uniref:cytochrome c oxidase subunit 3 n=1 Tax=Ekhidna sp. TaxID=2608089 RepID=UPI0032EBD2D0